MSEDEQVQGSEGEAGAGSQPTGAESITEILLQSPAALEALGRGLAPLLTQRLAEPERVSSQVSSQGFHPNINEGPPTHFPPPYYPYPYTYPMFQGALPQGGAHYSQAVQYPQDLYGRVRPNVPSHLGYPTSSSTERDRDPCGRVRPSVPGQPGCAPGSSRERERGLLATTSSTALVRSEEEEGDWEYLVDPSLSAEERRSLELGSERDESASEDEMGTERSTERDQVSEELSAFLSVALKKPMKPERRKKLTEGFPRPNLPQAKPPVLDKAMYHLVQKKKSVVSHDRFLSKLQLFASEAIGPLSYLLEELEAGRDVPKEKAITALQAAICLTGNTFAALSVERRRCILRNLNQQLLPLAEEDFENDGKLFGDNFGKRAKEHSDAIRSLSRSSSVFFRLGDPPAQQRYRQGLGGRGKGPANRFTPYRPKGGRWGKSGIQGRTDPKK